MLRATPVTPNRAFLDCMRVSSLPAMEGGDQARRGVWEEVGSLIEKGRE
jgi:hypothetical protein